MEQNKANLKPHLALALESIATDLVPMQLNAEEASAHRIKVTARVQGADGIMKQASLCKCWNEALQMWVDCPCG